MIRPDEINRLRDLRSADTDAHIDLCRPRVLVLARAVAGAYSNVGSAETVLSYFFTDTEGGSGLARGDILRGRLFGTYASDTGGPSSDTVLTLTVNSVATASILITRPDLSGDVIAVDCDFMLRFAGGETTSANSPLKSPSTTANAVLKAQFGDTSTSTWSRSQAVTDSWITATNVTGTAVNLAIPVRVSLTYEGTGGGLLTVYGGTMEGL